MKASVSDLGISVFFPAYDDAATIAGMVMGAMRILASITGDYEVIVVDDGSRDGTPGILEELLRLYPQHLRVERHIRNRGYGGAIKTGIHSATKEWVFYTDGDAQYDVRELVKLVERAKSSGEGRAEVDVVNGYKIARADPFYRKAIGAAYNLGVHFAFGLRVRDVDCDFRLMRRALFEKIELKSVSGTICVEMIKKLEDAGARFADVPVHHFHRSVGRSQFFRPYWIWKTLRDLLALWWELMGPRHTPPIAVSRDPQSPKRA